MGLMDIVNPDIQINIKFNDFSTLVRNSVKAELMMNGIKNEVDHDSIYKIMTGESLHEPVIEECEV